MPIILRCAVCDKPVGYAETPCHSHDDSMAWSPDCKLRIFVINGQSEWRCDGCGDRWVKAPTPQQHTDEEYDELLRQFQLTEAALMTERNSIKELEAEIKAFEIRIRSYP